MQFLLHISTLIPLPPILKHADFTAALYALNFLTSLYIGKVSLNRKKREFFTPNFNLVCSIIKTTQI